MADKKSKRAKDPLASLKKQFTLKSRAEEVDYDYLDKLSPSELEWLAKFTNEEIHAAVKSNGKKNTFNKSKEDIKRIYDKNNARNRCTWTREKAKGIGQYLEDHKDKLLSNNPEDYIAVKMKLESEGWVDKDGNILTTEDEVIKEAKLNEKKELKLLKSQRTKGQT
jgi:hypothetical protein